VKLNLSILGTLIISLGIISGFAANITLSVDMSTYKGSFNTVSVNGGFNGWGLAYALTNISGDIWEVSVPMTNGTHDYRFEVYPPFDAEDVFGECAENENRLITITQETGIDIVCRNSSDASIVTSNKRYNLSETQLLNVNPNPVNKILKIELYAESNEKIKYLIEDLLGNIVLNGNFYSAKVNNVFEVDLFQFENEFYILTIMDNKYGITKKVIKH
jgi:hypothetical protein